MIVSCMLSQCQICYKRLQLQCNCDLFLSQIVVNHFVEGNREINAVFLYNASLVSMPSFRGKIGKSFVNSFACFGSIYFLKFFSTFLSMLRKNES